MKRLLKANSIEDEIKRISQEYNASVSDIKAAMADGFPLDVIADWVSNGKNIYDLSLK